MEDFTNLFLQSRLCKKVCVYVLSKDGDVCDVNIRDRHCSEWGPKNTGAGTSDTLARKAPQAKLNICGDRVEQSAIEKVTSSLLWILKGGSRAKVSWNAGSERNEEISRNAQCIVHTAKTDHLYPAPMCDLLNKRPTNICTNQRVFTVFLCFLE